MYTKPNLASRLIFYFRFPLLLFGQPAACIDPPCMKNLRFASDHPAKLHCVNIPTQFFSAIFQDSEKNRIGEEICEGKFSFQNTQVLYDRILSVRHNLRKTLFNLKHFLYCSCSIHLEIKYG